MKKIILLFLMGLFVTIGCKDDLVTKPKNLIERDKMVDIIYDLSLIIYQFFYFFCLLFIIFYFFFHLSFFICYLPDIDYSLFD